MTVGTLANLSESEVIGRLQGAVRGARKTFRAWFILTWLVLVGALVAMLWATGNVKVDFIISAGPYILGGAGITILITVVSITFATILALLGAFGRLSRNPFVNGVASLYVSLVRGTPLLVQVFFVYLALPELGIVLPVIVGGIVALAFNYGAYMTEVFRAGIQAVPRGQREAAQALGMPEGLIMRRIVLPQALRIVTPAIGNDFISMIKDSSLVYVLGVPELLFRASTLGRRELASLSSLLIAAVIYWGLTIVFSAFQERLERRMARGDR
jgi:polar amino acid transport system permease protein